MINLLKLDDLMWLEGENESYQPKMNMVKKVQFVLIINNDQHTGFLCYDAHMSDLIYFSILNVSNWLNIIQHP